MVGILLLGHNSRLSGWDSFVTSTVLPTIALLMQRVESRAPTILLHDFTDATLLLVCHTVSRDT